MSDPEDFKWETQMDATPREHAPRIMRVVTVEFHEPTTSRNPFYTWLAEHQLKVVISFQSGRGHPDYVIVQISDDMENGLEIVLAGDKMLAADACEFRVLQMLHRLRREVQAMWFDIV